MEKKPEHPGNNPAGLLKVVLFGPESTGKTTLAKQLAEHFQTTWAPEYMRQFLEEKWDNEERTITKNDLIPIAKGQILAEKVAAKKATKIFFCDTDLLQLKVYSEYYYHDFCEPEITIAALQEKPVLYLLTEIDVPWEPDFLRDRPNDRQNMFRIFEDELKLHKLPYKIVSGPEYERLKTAIHAIEKMVPKT